MKGKHQIIVQNSLVQFKLSVERNITIIRGDSATGKSTLVDMIRQHELYGAESGVSISCRKECTVLTGLRWERELEGIRDSIVFLDEGFEFVSSREFADAVSRTDNYYVIATRDSLFCLPYSVKAIYGLKNVTRKSKYQEYDRIYSEFFPLYDEGITYQRPDAVIVEDSNSGFDFFNAICEREGIHCLSANGKSNIYRLLRECDEKIILVVADGAAFGPELERALSLRKVKNIVYYLPESFEWLILKSGLIDGTEVEDVLSHPYDFIESERYFNWERFFTALLVDKTANTHLEYSKSRLNKNFLNDREMQAIEDVVNGAISLTGSEKA